MMDRRKLVALFAVWLYQAGGAAAWLSSPSHQPFFHITSRRAGPRRTTSSSSSAGSGNSCARPPSTATSLSVASLNLEGTQIGTNHEQVGEELAQSLCRMLDSEWMPQEVHRKMGQVVKETYIECRESNEADLMHIMTTVADNLSEKWQEYDAEAFVNAWDIANYVSDYLTVQTGEEGCECTQKIY